MLEQIEEQTMRLLLQFDAGAVSTDLGPLSIDFERPEQPNKVIFAGHGFSEERSLTLPPRFTNRLPPVYGPLAG